jgi:hypothetical protein
VCHFCQKTGRATLWAILFTNSSGIPDLGQKLWFEFLYFLRNKNVKLLRGIVILKDYYPLSWIFLRIFSRIFSRISLISLISFPFSVSLCPFLSGPGPPRRIPGRTANPEKEDFIF